MKIIFISCFFSLLLNYSFSQDATNIYNSVVNSTVTIKVSNSKGPKGWGSGFFVDNNIIATNYHVIDGATKAVCYTTDEYKSYEIEGYVAIDRSADLALLKVKGLNRPPVKFATGIINPGEKIYVIGTPLNESFEASISDGIISGVRDFDGKKLIQITAPISSGNSGGPVLNSKAEVIGITVSTISPIIAKIYKNADVQNINFAVPKSNLELMLGFKKKYAIPLSTLLPANEGGANQISENEENNKPNLSGNDEIQNKDKNEKEEGFYVLNKEGGTLAKLPIILPIQGSEDKERVSAGFKKYHKAFFPRKYSTFIINDNLPVFYFVLPNNVKYNFLDYVLFISSTGWQLGEKRAIAYGKSVKPIKGKFERVKDNLFKFTVLEKLRSGQSYIFSLKTDVMAAPCYEFHVLR